MSDSACRLALSHLWPFNLVLWHFSAPSFFCTLFSSIPVKMWMWESCTTLWQQHKARHKLLNSLPLICFPYTCSEFTFPLFSLLCCFLPPLDRDVQYKGTTGSGDEGEEVKLLSLFLDIEILGFCSQRPFVFKYQKSMHFWGKILVFWIFFTEKAFSFLVGPTWMLCSNSLDCSWACKPHWYGSQNTGKQVALCKSKRSFQKDAGAYFDSAIARWQHGHDVTGKLVTC